MPSYWSTDENFFKWMQEKWRKNIEKRQLPKELIYPYGKMPITEYLEKVSSEHPDKTAIVYYGAMIKYNELNSAVNKFANFLIEKGVSKGSFVGIHLYNSPQYYIAHFGAMKAGAVVVPLDPLWKEMELEAPFKDTKMNVIVTQDINYNVVKNVKKKYGTEYVVTGSLQDFLPQKPTIPILDIHKYPKKTLDGTIDMQSILDSYDDFSPSMEVKLEDPASLDYTGGTTGPPKACLHNHLGIIYTRACMYTYFNLREDTRFLEFVPLFHTAGRGIMEGLVFAGGTNIILTKFELKAFITSIVIYKPTSMWGPSDLYYQIVHTPKLEYDFSCIRHAYTTQYNVSLDEDLREKWSKLTKGGTLCDITYGLTETLSMNTFTLGLQEVDLKKQKELGPVFVGLPMPETYIKIVDRKTKDILPPMEVGEIAIKDPALPGDYFNRLEETKKSFLSDGFLLTGDLGMYDDDGFYYYRGRTKEIIKVSGFTVSPREIELIMSNHPAIDSVAIVGIPDTKKGEAPIAFIVLKREYKEKVSEKDIIKWCRENIASYKVPIKIFFTEQLPYLLGLKIDREKLKKEAKQKLGL